MKYVALTIALIGILTLLLIINFQEPQNIQISSINNNHLNKQIKITGQVTNINIYKNNFTTFNLNNNTAKIQVICNCPNIKQYKNQNIEVTGKLTKYNNSLQIQANKINL